MKYKLLLTISLTITLAEHGRSESLKNFVSSKMANYSTWLKANNLDPSPRKAGPDWFKTFEQPYDPPVELDLYLSNHGVRGHSELIDVGQVWADEQEQFFQVQFNSYGDIVFYGDYKANGTVYDFSLNPISVNASGRFHLKFTKVNHIQFRIWYNATSEGFLDVTEHDLYGLHVPREEKVIDFQGLWKGQKLSKAKKYIQDALYAAFGTSLYIIDVGKNHPLRTMYLEYWREILAGTRLEDISGK